MTLRRHFTTLVACAVTALALVQTAPAAPRMLVGAAEDAAKNTNVVEAQANMTLASLAGFNAIRLTALWAPGMTRPTADELLGLSNAATAAELNNIRIFVAVYPARSRQVPLTRAARTQFSQFAASVAEANPYVRDFIIGNEPNLNTFWMPQFTRNGGNAAANAYTAALAQTYDALKRVSGDIKVVGGSLSPRGEDKPRSIRPTHSPTTFIRDMGLAYRKSGRKRPIMDAFAIHPYSYRSHVVPTLRHPRSKTIGLGDYGKLVGLLGKAFNGTRQKGSTLPIVYDEFGVQSRIPVAKQRWYENRDAPGAHDAVSEAVQGSYYRRALRLVACQKNVHAFLIFHVTDERDLGRWQSGVYYADGTPKASLAPFKQAIAQLQAGKLRGCGVAKR